MFVTFLNCISRQIENNDLSIRCFQPRTVWRCTFAGLTAAPDRLRVTFAAKPSVTQSVWSSTKSCTLR